MAYRPTHDSEHLESVRLFDDEDDQIIVIETTQIHRFIAIVIALLVVAAAWALVAVYGLDLTGTAVGDLSVRYFDLDEEFGLPAAFSFLFLLTTACVVFLGTWVRSNEPSVAVYAWRWRLLAAALAFVAFDEAFEIHEHLSGYLRVTFGFNGFLYFPWVIPYAAAALVLAAVMATPLAVLPRRKATLLVTGGLLYVLGAVGVEMIGGQLKSSNAPMYLYETEIVIEELLEWAGVWTFLTGMLRLLSGATLRLRVAEHQ